MEKDFEHIQSILGKVVQKNKKLRQVVDDIEIKNVIRDVLGEKIQPYIREIKINKDQIFIHSHQSVLREELHLHKSTLLTRINEKVRLREFVDIIVRN